MLHYPLLLVAVALPLFLGFALFSAHLFALSVRGRALGCLPKARGGSRGGAACERDARWSSVCEILQWSQGASPVRWQFWADLQQRVHAS